jgi:hypothetical protein
MSQPRSPALLSRLDPWVRSSRILSAECKLVLIALVEFDAVASSHGEHEALDTSHQMIADVCGMPPKRVRLALRDLQGLGLVSTAQRRGGRFPLLVTIHYRVLADRLDAGVDAAGAPPGRRRRVIGRDKAASPTDRGLSRVA